MIDMKKMKIGDKFRAPAYLRVWETKPEEGTIVYIHPERRFFTVEFIKETGVRIRESYHPAVLSRIMRKKICRLRLSEVSRQ